MAMMFVSSHAKELSVFLLLLLVHTDLNIQSTWSQIRTFSELKKALLV